MALTIGRPVNCGVLACPHARIRPYSFEKATFFPVFKKIRVPRSVFASPHVYDESIPKG